MQQALESHNAFRGEVLHDQIDARHKALVETEAQIERLVRFVADGGDRLDYVAERIQRFESDARAQKAELEILRSTWKRPLRKVSCADVDATIANLAVSKPDEVGCARLRLRRWTAGVPMCFNGRTLTIEISPTALVADIANAGGALPSYPDGEHVVLQMPVGYLVPRQSRELRGRPISLTQTVPVNGRDNSTYVVRTTSRADGGARQRSRFL